MEDEPVYAGIMVIVGFLSTFFNKNMIIIIFTSIAITNLVRFGMEQYNKEGFTGDLSQLDNLMSHMTNDDKDQPLDIKDGTTTDDKLTDMDGELDYDKNAKLNEDPTKRDEEIDKYIKKLNLAGLLKQMETGVNKENAELAKDKISLALKYMDKIANDDQRKGVEKLLNIQLKLIDQIISIAPLVDEFRDVVKIFKL